MTRSRIEKEWKLIYRPEQCSRVTAKESGLDAEAWGEDKGGIRQNPNSGSSIRQLNLALQVPTSLTPVTQDG